MMSTNHDAPETFTEFRRVFCETLRAALRQGDYMAMSEGLASAVALLVDRVEALERTVARLEAKER